MSDFTEFADEAAASGTREAGYQSRIDAAIIEANGRACEGLGLAIGALGQKCMGVEAQELALQLKYMSKSLSWMLREVTNRRAPWVDQPAKNGTTTTRGK